MKSHTIEIRHTGQVALAKRTTAGLADQIGFDPIAINEIAIVVTELATNILKHGAINGRIMSSIIEKDGHRGLEIISLDEGPGITDVYSALDDGFSTQGTSGTGLGAVNRLMDEFEIESITESELNIEPSKKGTKIICRKWKFSETEQKTSARHSIKISVMERAKLGERISGDAYFIKQYNNIHFIAAIDGLGHGEEANKASQAAIGYIENNYKRDIEEIFHGVHRVCKSTRGVVMSVCRIDMNREILTYAGIGNVTTRVFYNSPPIHPTNFNGILGVSFRKIHVFEYQWKEGMVLMYTDGISGNWKISEFPDFRNASSIEIASQIFKLYSRNNDDSTIIVGR